MKKTILILIGLLFALLVVAFLLEKQPEEGLIVNEEIKDLAEWKTYTNEEYGFKFSYPSKIFVEDFMGKEAEFEVYVEEYIKDIGGVDNKIIEVYGMDRTHGSQPLTIRIKPNIENSTLNTEYEALQSLFRSGNHGMFEVDGVDAFWLDTHEMGSYISVVVKDDYVYYFNDRFFGWKVEGILDTFEFLK